MRCARIVYKRRHHSSPNSASLPSGEQGRRGWWRGKKVILIVKKHPNISFMYSQSAINYQSDVEQTPYRPTSVCSYHTNQNAQLSTIITTNYHTKTIQTNLLI